MEPGYYVAIFVVTAVALAFGGAIVLEARRTVKGSGEPGRTLHALGLSRFGADGWCIGVLQGRRTCLRVVYRERGANAAEALVALHENIRVGLATVGPQAYDRPPPEHLAIVDQLVARPEMLEVLRALKGTGWSVHIGNRAVSARRTSRLDATSARQLPMLATLAGLLERARTELPPGDVPHSSITEPARPRSEREDAALLRPIAEACGLEVKLPPVRMEGRRGDFAIRVDLEPGAPTVDGHRKASLYGVVTVRLPGALEGAFYCCRSLFFDEAFLETWVDTKQQPAPELEARLLRFFPRDPAGGALGRREDVHRALAAMPEPILAVFAEGDRVTVVTHTVPERPEQLDAMIRASIAIAEPVARGVGTARPYR